LAGLVALVARDAVLVARGAVLVARDAVLVARDAVLVVRFAGTDPLAAFGADRLVTVLAGEP
jgi:hypothetical protein